MLRNTRVTGRGTTATAAVTYSLGGYIGCIALEIHENPIGRFRPQ